MMKLNQNSLLVVAIVLSGMVVKTAFAQDDFFGVNNADLESGGDLESEEGLESATPTNSVDELNTGTDNSQFSENNAGGEANFPAADDEAGFDLNTGENGSDNIFGDEPANGGQGGNANFSNQPAQGNTQAIPNGTQNSAPVQANPLQQAIPQQAPLQQAPANAQTLMNQINTNPAANPTGAPANGTAVPVNPAMDPAAADPSAVTSATGEETLLPSNPEPAIEAPPLPPPNEFSGSPPVPGSMRLLAESEAPEEYLVQPGDTLFDICDQLLDEPAYWPKLWALNPEIKNPHFIFPNMKLRFYPGDDETPPYLQVVAEDEMIPIEKGDLDEQELIAEKIVFEEEEAFGGSLGVEVIGSEDLEEITDMVLGSGSSFRSEEVRVQVPGFIFEDEKEPEGYIVGGRNGEVSLAPGQKVIVESSGGISAGTVYSVLRQGEKVVNPDTGDFVGYLYYFVGNVRIQKTVDDGLYMAMVENNRLSVRPDDMVVSYISTFRTVPITTNVGSTSSIDSQVVGFEYDGQVMGGQSGFAFINKGSSDGVSPGMYVPIYQNPGYITRWIGNAGLPEDQEFIGVMRIIDATPAGAVGFIVKNSKELRIGDRTGKG